MIHYYKFKRKEMNYMADVKQRMIDIVNSVPEDFFDGLKPTEMVF